MMNFPSLFPIRSAALVVSGALLPLAAAPAQAQISAAGAVIGGSRGKQECQSFGVGIGANDFASATCSLDPHMFHVGAAGFGAAGVTGGAVDLEAFDTPRGHEYTAQGFGVSLNSLRIESKTPVSTLLFHEMIAAGGYVQDTHQGSVSIFGAFLGSGNGTDMDTGAFFASLASDGTTSFSTSNFMPDPTGGIFTASLHDGFTGNYYFLQSAGASLSARKPTAGTVYNAGILMFVDGVTALDANGNKVSDTRFWLDGRPFGVTATPVTTAVTTATTTPEPSSLALLGTGFATLVPVLRRRRRG